MAVFKFKAVVILSLKRDSRKKLLHRSRSWKDLRSLFSSKITLTYHDINSA